MVKYSFSEDNEISLEEVVQKQGRLIDRLTYELSEQKQTVRYLADKLHFFIDRLPFNEDRRIQSQTYPAPSHQAQFTRYGRLQPQKSTQNQAENSLQLDENKHKVAANSSSRSSLQYPSEANKIKRQGTRISFNDDSESDDTHLSRNHEIPNQQNSRTDREPKFAHIYGKKLGYQSEEAKEQVEQNETPASVPLVIEQVEIQSQEQLVMRPIPSIIFNLPQEEEHFYGTPSQPQKHEIQIDQISSLENSQDDQKLSENQCESSNPEDNPNLDYKSASSDSNEKIDYSDTQILNPTPDRD